MELLAAALSNVGVDDPTKEDNSQSKYKCQDPLGLPKPVLTLAGINSSPREYEYIADYDAAFASSRTSSRMAVNPEFRATGLISGAASRLKNRSGITGGFGIIDPLYPGTLTFMFSGTISKCCRIFAQYTKALMLAISWPEHIRLPLEKILKSLLLSN